MAPALLPTQKFARPSQLIEPAGIKGEKKLVICKHASSVCEFHAQWSSGVNTITGATDTKTAGIAL
jgi:hypothetical protein